MDSCIFICCLLGWGNFFCSSALVLPYSCALVAPMLLNSCAPFLLCSCRIDHQSTSTVDIDGRRSTWSTLTDVTNVDKCAPICQRALPYHYWYYWEFKNWIVITNLNSIANVNLMHQFCGRSPTSNLVLASSRIHCSPVGPPGQHCTVGKVGNIAQSENLGFTARKRAVNSRFFRLILR